MSIEVFKTQQPFVSRLRGELFNIFSWFSYSHPPLAHSTLGSRHGIWTRSDRPNPLSGLRSGTAALAKQAAEKLGCVSGHD